VITNKKSLLERSHRILKKMEARERRVLQTEATKLTPEEVVYFRKVMKLLASAMKSYAPLNALHDKAPASVEPQRANLGATDTLSHEMWWKIGDAQAALERIRHVMAQLEKGL